MTKSFFPLLLSALLAFASPILQGQNWRHYRSEIFLGVGAGNFLGELGGANKEGRNFIQDLELAMTRPAVTFGHRWKIAEVFCWKNSFTYGRLNGDDALTEEQFRQNRNMHFRTALLELSTQLEFYFIKEKLGHLYRTRAVEGRGVHLISAYLFGGGAGINFNPKAKYTDGRWYALKPLGTEGQGLPGGPKPYSLFSIALPYGVGFKYTLNRHWNIGLEIGNRKTFTDYMDDVSTVYYDNDAIRAAKNDVAAYFADPNIGIIPPWQDGLYIYDPTGPGQQRGDPSDNDSYAFIFLSINYKFLKGRYNLPKF